MEELLRDLDLPAVPHVVQCALVFLAQAVGLYGQVELLAVEAERPQMLLWAHLEDIPIQELDVLIGPSAEEPELEAQALNVGEENEVLRDSMSDQDLVSSVAWQGHPLVQEALIVVVLEIESVVHGLSDLTVLWPFTKVLLQGAPWDSQLLAP